VGSRLPVGQAKQSRSRNDKPSGVLLAPALPKAKSPKRSPEPRARRPLGARRPSRAMLRVRPLPEPLPVHVTRCGAPLRLGLRSKYATRWCSRHAALGHRAHEGRNQRARNLQRRSSARAWASVTMQPKRATQKDKPERFSTKDDLLAKLIPRCAAGHVFSLITSVRLYGLEPEAYLRDLFRVLAHWPRDRYLELAPEYWAATRSSRARAARRGDRGSHGAAAVGLGRAVGFALSSRPRSRPDRGRRRGGAEDGAGAAPTRPLRGTFGKYAILPSRSTSIRSSANGGRAQERTRRSRPWSSLAARRTAQSTSKPLWVAEKRRLCGRGSRRLAALARARRAPRRRCRRRARGRRRRREVSAPARRRGALPRCARRGSRVFEGRRRPGHG
jgi:hypothetical protein